MSRIIIYLGRLSPDASRDLPKARRATLTLTFGLASDGVYMAPPVTRRTVVSYTAFPPLPLVNKQPKLPKHILISIPLSLHQDKSGGISLLH